ncbi:MAG: phage tail assembly chaperone [Hyphomicrobiales bacterium]
MTATPAPSRTTAQVPASAPAKTAPSRPPFPWQDAIAFGLRVLRLPPDAFWRMTPLELAAAAGQTAAAPPDRAALADLMVRFPDN